MQLGKKRCPHCRGPVVLIVPVGSARTIGDLGRAPVNHMMFCVGAAEHLQYSCHSKKLDVLRSGMQGNGDSMHMNILHAVMN